MVIQLICFVNYRILAWRTSAVGAGREKIFYVVFHVRCYSVKYVYQGIWVKNAYCKLKHLVGSVAAVHRVYLSNLSWTVKTPLKDWVLLVLKVI